MLFDIETVSLQTGQTEHWKYNSCTNDLYSPKGDLIERIPVDCNNFNTNKSHYIQQLTIQLGLKCNEQCVYCLQSQRDLHETHQSVDVDRFVSLLSQLEFAERCSVEFWGGEPLVYWKTVKKLIPKLRQIMPQSARFYFTTNGTLLDKQKVDFLYNNRVAVLLSHDGKYNLLTRGYELGPIQKQAIQYSIELTANDENWLKTKYNSVITDYNADINDHSQYMNRLFPGIIPLRQQPLFNINSDFVSRVAFTKTNLYVNTSIERYFNHNETQPFKSLYKRIEFDLTHKTSDKVRYRCGVFKPNYLCVDLNGNMLYCHNELQKYGHLSQYDQAQIQLTMPQTREGCKDCTWLSICNGGCPLRESVGENCGYYPMYSVLFYIFMREHFNVSITNIKPYEI